MEGSGGGERGGRSPHILQAEIIQARLFSLLFRRTREQRIWACPHLRGEGLQGSRKGKGGGVGEVGGGVRGECLLA